MSIIKKLIKSGVEYFAASSTETITSSTLVKNAISNNIAALNTNPRLKKIGANNYISFGSNDDMPDIISTLLDKSTTHSGIVRKKSKMVAGKEMTSDVDEKKWLAFYNNAGGYGVSLYEQFMKAAYNYEKDGGFLLVITSDVEEKTSEPILLEVFNHSRFRVAAPENGEVTGYVLRDVFKNVSGGVFSNEEEVIPKFDPAEQQEKYAIYVKNPFSTNPFYGTPNYISAFDFIESDFEFGRTIKNSARNGFAPRLLATFIGRNMSDEQKATEAASFKTNFNGADSENVIMSYVRRSEDAPQFDKLDVNNLDKTIDVMARLNDSKILTAHNVTSPTLFGIMVAGKLGGTGNELYSAYELFRTTDILPDRELILNAFALSLSASLFKDATFEIVDEDMSFLMSGNNNTEEKSTETETETEDDE